MAVLCLYNEVVNFINHVIKLQDLPEYIIWKNQAVKNKANLYFKTYKSLFAKKQKTKNLSLDITQNLEKASVSNSFQSIREFINKSLDVSNLSLENRIKILLHLNRLIAFSYEDILSAGLRGLNQEVKDDNRASFLRLDYISYPYTWSNTLVQEEFCLFDMLKQFLDIVVLNPFRAYNVQTAFAWLWVLEKSCYKMFHYKAIRNLPLSVWVIKFIRNKVRLQSNFHGLNKELVDFYILQISEIIEDIQLPVIVRKMLNQRQQKGFRLLLKTGCISRKEYSRKLKVSFMTAYRDLQFFVQQGLATKQGENNKTIYCLSDSKKS